MTKEQYAELTKELEQRGCKVLAKSDCFGYYELLKVNDTSITLFIMSAQEKQIALLWVLSVKPVAYEFNTPALDNIIKTATEAATICSKSNRLGFLRLMIKNGYKRTSVTETKDYIFARYDKENEPTIRVPFESYEELQSVG